MSTLDAPVLERVRTTSSVDDEKKDGFPSDVDLAEVEGDLEALEADIAAAQADAEKLTYEDARLIVMEIVDEYQLDPNFPPHIMESAVAFLEDPTLKASLSVCAAVPDCPLTAIGRSCSIPQGIR